MPRVNFTAEVVKHKRVYYRIVNIYFDEYKYVLPDKLFFPISDEIALKLKSDIFSGNIVIVRRKLLENGTCKEEDFTIERRSRFDLLKNREIVNVKNTIGALGVNTSFFEVYEFIAVTGMLASQGIFITDENREETYLNIINTGDEELISALETYLEIKDTMDTLFKRYKNRVDYLRALERTENQTELDSVKKVWNRE